MGADKMINLEKSGGVSLNMEQLSAQMAELSGDVSQFVTRVGTAIPVAILDAGWHLGKSKGMLLATELVLGVSMLLSACGISTNVNTEPGTGQQVIPTEHAEVIPTATYAVGNTESSGLPLDVESIKSIDPYDASHVKIRANEIADFVKESLGPDVSKNLSYWEVYGKTGGAAGMLANFSYSDAQWIMASYGPDGLGYLGTDADPLVAMQLVKDANGYISIVTPDGLRQIFETDANGNVTGFLPFGEADWVENQSSVGKFQASPTEVPVGLIDLLKNGGHYDFKQSAYVDSVGGLVYVVGKNGEVSLAVDPIVNTEAGKTAVALFNEIKVDPSTYELKMDGEVMIAIDKATGKEVMRDGRFDLHYLIPNLPTEDLMKINVAPINGKFMSAPFEVSGGQYGPYNMKIAQESVIKEAFPDLNSLLVSTIFVHDYSLDGGDGYAWGYVAFDKKGSVPPYFYYYDSNKVLQPLIPIQPIAPLDIANFYVSQ